MARSIKKYKYEDHWKIRLGFFVSNLLQGSEISNRSELSANLDVRNVSNMPPPSKLVQPVDNGMPHPPPRNMPPPPPPKFTLLAPTEKLHDKNNSLNKTKSDNIPGKNGNYFTFFSLFFLLLNCYRSEKWGKWYILSSRRNCSSAGHSCICVSNFYYPLLSKPCSRFWYLGQANGIWGRWRRLTWGRWWRILHQWLQF